MSIWRELIHVEYLGPFINTDKGCCYKTNDIYSSIDEYYYDGKKSWAIRSHRLREFTYVRVETKSGKGSIVLWHKERRYMSPEFNQMYYLPFQRCFMGVNSNRVVLFSANPEEEKYLFEETCASVFVSGRFFFYSLDGVKWGVWDSEVQLKIEPFMQFEEIKKGSLNHTWTDEYYPVKIDNYYYLMDCHGNCFCKSLPRIYKYKNIFATKNGEEDYPSCFGLNEKNELVIVRKDVRGYILSGILCEYDAHRYTRLLNAYGQHAGRKIEEIDYYGNIISAGKIRCEYFSHFLKLKNYEFCYKRLHTCFWLIQHTADHAKETRYGIINTETNEIIVEPVCEEIKTYGPDLLLAYGDRYIFLNEQGKFYRTEKRTL